MIASTVSAIQIVTLVIVNMPTGPGSAEQTLDDELIHRVENQSAVVGSVRFSRHLSSSRRPCGLLFARPASANLSCWISLALRIITLMPAAKPRK